LSATRSRQRTFRSWAALGIHRLPTIPTDGRPDAIILQSDIGKKMERRAGQATRRRVGWGMGLGLLPSEALATVTYNVC
jgi:hypothetical protein